MNSIATTKKGNLFYDELVRPMERLAKRNKELGIAKLSVLNKKMVEDMFIMNSRGLQRVCD
jgi:hypothetical protein